MRSDAAPVPRPYVVWLALLFVGMLLGALALRAVDNPGDVGRSAPEGAVGQLAEGTTSTPVATNFTMSSVNVLGAGHTAPGGNRTGFASGAYRMKLMVELLRGHDVDVVGFQELQEPQYDKFVALTGAEFAMYPGNVGRSQLRNSIAWRLDTWELVSASWIRIPYFGGERLKMPVVLLRNIGTGQQAYFSNFHNPSNARGDAERWRDQATDLEIDLVNRLRAQTGLPVFVTGDMNEKSEYFCRMTRGAEMVSASGGSNDSSGCRPATPLYVDWIFGSVETTFTGYIADRSEKVRKSTDHPLVVAQAELPPPLVPFECPA